jgi:intergrase/recombinase
VEIAESARKHGIADEDIQHALRQPIRVVPGIGRDLFIGSDSAGRLLEIVILDDDPNEQPVVIHALPLRPKFHDYLR